MILDFNYSSDIVREYSCIEAFSEIKLIDTICDALYENHVNFIVGDGMYKNYGMDCKFDLPCVMDSYDDIILGIRENKDFNIEFYEQGQEHLMTFIWKEEYVHLKIVHEYDVDNAIQYILDSSKIKDIFIKFFSQIFEYSEHYIKDIGKNIYFRLWKKKFMSINM